MVTSRYSVDEGRRRVTKDGILERGLELECLGVDHWQPSCHMPSVRKGGILGRGLERRVEIVALPLRQLSERNESSKGDWNFWSAWNWISKGVSESEGTGILGRGLEPGTEGSVVNRLRPRWSEGDGILERGLELVCGADCDDDWVCGSQRGAGILERGLEHGSASEGASLVGLAVSEGTESSKGDWNSGQPTRTSSL